MIKNYFRIAIRNVRRQATYSILNICGMAIGMASAILILLWVQDEGSYYRHFKNADNLYRILEKISTGTGIIMAPTAEALPHVLKEEYP
jgi:putative ABC transport system permease protein